MISYAQNFEDVMLARALRDVGAGFYVDLGAFHPTVDSVTRHFYDHGWHGINIEPHPKFFAALQRERPRDDNLAVAVAGQAGRARLHQRDGLSTIRPGEGAGASPVIEVEAVTLDEVLARVPASVPVDFLKIDVEGAEAEILGATRFDRVRPRIVLVEATLPDSQVPAWDDWEPGLLTQDYDFVWFDGLNRFYLRREDAWRSRFFQTPPNVFDGFRLRASDSRVVPGI